jgi:glycosyltransferase involved in cell wall biosynthesis
MPEAFTNSFNADLNNAIVLASDTQSVAKRKFVLFIIRSGEYGGAQKHLLDLISRFAGFDVELSVICLDTGRGELLSRSEAMDVQIRCGKDAKSFREWFVVFRSLRPDAVVFVRSWVWSFPWHTSVAAWLARIPRRFTILHMTPPPLPSSPKRSWVRRVAWMWRQTRHVLSLRLPASFDTTTVCVSNSIRESLVKHYRFPAEKTITVHNGIHLSEFDQKKSDGPQVRAKLRIGTKEFVLVCTARLSEHKRLDLLLRAIAKLLRDGVGCKCIIVGDGPLREELCEQALGLGLSGHVFFEGFQKDVRPYLQAADAFVLSSATEGLPLSLLEAMACGLPCVVTDVGGTAEVVTDGVHGLVVPPGSAAKIADAIAYLVRHPDERAQMSVMARERVRYAFDIESRMAELRDLILD